MKHYSEDDLTLYYYGESRRRLGGGGRDAIEQHLAECAACAHTYRDIAATLAMIETPDVPERGDQYGLEVWQRIRHQLPERGGHGWSAWFRFERLTFVAAAAAIAIVAFVAGRWSPREVAHDGVRLASSTLAERSGERKRILLTAVADHLDRSDRLLTDILNTSASTDISTEQQWADDLLATSRLYRQDAIDAGETSIASVLDDLERNLVEIVHSPSNISAADLEQLRRRIDAAALLFKVRIMSDELRKTQKIG